ncbi:MAG TPA: L,D-transpeptidase [Gemmatimonadaceae bacterium]|nr:L,D-transpeptidase [Gemmatimonadaceae bacterium]
MGIALFAVVPGCATAQHFGERIGVVRGGETDSVRLAGNGGGGGARITPSLNRLVMPMFKSRKDSLEWASARRQALASAGYRVIVSLTDRYLWVLDGEDTLRQAPVAVGRGADLSFDGKKWTFETPRGLRKVLRKESDPKWIPPEWAYAEVALEHNLKMRHLTRKSAVTLKDGRRLVVRGDVVGLLPRRGETGGFAPLPVEEHIVFGNTLYIPPTDTKNRKIEGELGKYRLDLGNGYLLHGTPHQASIGSAATHGCVRLRDEDIEWLYNNVPVGSKVYIF